MTWDFGNTELFNFDSANEWIEHCEKGQVSELVYVEKYKESMYECPDFTGTKTEVVEHYGLSLTDKYLTKKLNRCKCRKVKEQKKR
jgi:hypothetical protein